MQVLVLFTKEVYSHAARRYDIMNDARVMDVDTVSERTINEAFRLAVKENLNFYADKVAAARSRGGLIQAIDPGVNHKLTGYLAHVGSNRHTRH